MDRITSNNKTQYRTEIDTTMNTNGGQNFNDKTTITTNGQNFFFGIM